MYLLRRAFSALIGTTLLALPLLADSAAGISWTPPAAWKAQPQRPMRAATYLIAPVTGDKEEAECAVFFFGQGQGGGVQANIDRWLGQFENKPATPPQPKKETVNGIAITTIEHAGTYLSGGPMSPVKTPKPGFQMVGSIVEAPEGNVFFKLTGPSKTVAAARPAFDKMIRGVRK